MTSSTHQHTAAKIAAAAIFETFPEVELIGARESRFGFSYDLVFPHPIHSETVAMVEQAMRQIAREGREIRLMEMVPFSAKELLKAKGHAGRAQLIDRGGLVQVVQIGSFYDLSEGECLGNTQELAAFKIDRIEPVEGDVVRVTGFASSSKEELKDFLKNLRRYREKRHEAVGQAKGLWRIEKEGTVWLSKGLKIWEKLARFLEEKILVGIESVAAPSKLFRMELAKRLAKPVAEIRLHPPTFWKGEMGLLGLNGPGIEIFSLVVSKSNFANSPITSLLHLIEKSLNILGLKYKREFFVADMLGNEWQVVSVKKIPEGTVVTVSVEKILALLLESDELMEPFLIENQ